MKKVIKLVIGLSMSLVVLTGCLTQNKSDKSAEEAFRNAVANNMKTNATLIGTGSATKGQHPQTDANNLMDIVYLMTYNNGSISADFYTTLENGTVENQKIISSLGATLNPQEYTKAELATLEAVNQLYKASPADFVYSKKGNAMGKLTYTSDVLNNKLSDGSYASDHIVIEIQAEIKGFRVASVTINQYHIESEKSITEADLMAFVKAEDVATYKAQLAAEQNSEKSALWNSTFAYYQLELISK